MSLDTLARAYRARPGRFVALCVLAALALRLLMTPFGAPLNLDAFAYMLKAREIAAGIWTPIRTHAIGWSLLLAPFAGPARSTAAAMTVTRLLAVTLSALAIVPLHAIARRTISDEAGALGLCFAVVALQSINVAVRGMSEPLHTLLLLTAVAAALDAAEHDVAAVGCGVSSGLACWVHPTGPLVLLAALATIAASGRHRTGTIVTVTLVAIAVAAPAAAQRLAAFGSPLAFGENNRVFANSPDDMWSAHVPVPTLGDFLRTHSARSIARWILVDGLASELLDFAVKSLAIALVPFALVGAWTAGRDARARRLLFPLAVFLAGWIVPYPVLGASRHLAPVLPVALLVSAIGVHAFTAVFRRGAVAALVVIGIAAGQIVAAAVQRERLLNDESVAGLEWGQWIATHVRGRVAVREGQELIMMHVADARIGGADINTMYAERSGLFLMKPGLFRTTAEALAWMRGQGATHIVLDYASDMPAYLDQLRQHPDQPYLRQVYSSVGQSRWPVRVCEIHWQ